MSSTTTTTPSATETTSTSDVPPTNYLDCPVERDVLGRHSWTLLHSIAANVPDKPTQHQQKELGQFMTTLSNFYPCQFCAEEFRVLYANGHSSDDLLLVGPLYIAVGNITCPSQLRAETRVPYGRDHTVLYLPPGRYDIPFVTTANLSWYSI